MEQPCVLLLGATGRTGGEVLRELLSRGVPVRAIVRSADRLPAGVAGDPLLTVVESDLLTLPPDEVHRQMAGCDVLISCLGHRTNPRGIFGPPLNLVTRALRTMCDARTGDLPLRVILMSTVAVNDRPDPRRGRGERAVLWMLRAVLPPARDNQRAADFLAHEIGTTDPGLEWVVVRPDTLKPGAGGPYRVSPGLTASLARPDHTTMANIGRFMAELATDDSLWRTWRFQMPVLTDEPSDETPTATMEG